MKIFSPSSPKRLALAALIIFATASALLLTLAPTKLQRAHSLNQNADERARVATAEGVAARPGSSQDAARAQSRGVDAARKASSKEKSVAPLKTSRDEVAENETAAVERSLDGREEEEARPDQPDEAERWRLLQMVDENGRIPERALMNAWEHAKRMPFESSAWPVENQQSTKSGADNISIEGVAGIDRTSWTPLGPGNVGGRIRSIVIHPTDPNTMWIGSVGGGIWKTTNGGASWTPLNDFMANLAVSCMAIDPRDSNVLYAGTGEGFSNADAIRGAGIFKTTDGGATWTQLTSTQPVTGSSNWLFVNRIAINPNDSNIILAATSTGIWRSTNGGAQANQISWTQVTTTRTLDIDFNPADGSKAIASGTNGVGAFYSTNGGQTWSAATGLPTGGRIEIAYSRSNPSIVYASANVNSGEIYRSTDGGQTYTQVNTGNNYLSGQGWYDNIIWVDPTNSNTIIVGGIDLWRGTFDSTSGNVTLTQISRWQSAPPFGSGTSLSAHADQHMIVESPQYNGTTNRTVFFGDDGGIFRANDINSLSLTSPTGWNSLNNGFGATQFYGGAGNPTSGVIVGGTQDNGTVTYLGDPNTWTTNFGGDGGFCAADPTDPNYFYGEYVYLQIHRSINGGLSSNYIKTGLTDAGTSSGANFIAPFILDPNNPNTMLAGGAHLWRSTNVKAPTPTWASIKDPVGSGMNISTIAVAKGNSDIIWVGYGGSSGNPDNGDVYFTTNGTSATPTWTRVDNGSIPLPNRYCERIVIDPTNSSRVYVTFGGFSTGNVWRTNDSGATWTDISSNLPAAPVYAFAVWQQNPSFLYAGTEVGIFASADGGTSWSTSNDGPTNCSVDDLFWMNNTLVAVTHGRGMFSIPLTSGGLLSQMITFGALSNRTFGDAPFPVSATASSNLSVSFSSQTTSVCTVSSNTVTILAAGTCTIRASQGGDATYLPATPVDQSFTVAKATPVITWNNPANISAGTPLTSTQLNATANVPGSFTYTPAAGATFSAGTYQLSVTFTPTDAANYNNATKTVQLTVVASPALPAISFSSATYSVNESNGNIPVTVNRTGDTSASSSVNYATSDAAGLAACSQPGTGKASSRCDYATTVGTLQFAAGETSKTIFIPIVNDSYAEGNESFAISLSSPAGATLDPNSAAATITIVDDDTTTGGNPIVDNSFFIRQQYIDFLGREPDSGGLAGWLDVLQNCGTKYPQPCDRIEVSAGFFRSPEFQDRGFFVFRFYPVALGRNPAYNEFMPDLAKVSGFLDAQQLEANKVAFVNEFLSRAEFQTRYGSLSDSAFHDALVQMAGIDPGISFPNGTMTRAQFLRAFVESTPVYQKFFNQAFVVMQYFGYLRRDPDILYLDWIKTMNQNGGDYRTMINGFMNSSEYFLRFGP